MVKHATVCSSALIAVGACLVPSSPAIAQGGPMVPPPPCDASVTTINARVSITRETLNPGPNETIVYYDGWSGNCWDSTQDAFVLAPLGTGPVTFSISIYDSQGLSIRYTDAAGAWAPGQTLDATKTVVFGAVTSKGRIQTPLSNWPIPGLPPQEQAEFSGFAFSPDGKTLTFTDRDNTGQDYHFGVWLVDPVSPGTGAEYRFISDPGTQSKGVGNR